MCSGNPLERDSIGNQNGSQQPIFFFLFVRPLYITDGRVVASVGGLGIWICSLCKSFAGLSTKWGH